MIRLLIDFALKQISKTNLSVFLFHAVPDTPPQLQEELDIVKFKTMISFIGETFNVIPLDQAVECLGRGGLPPNAACLTFDDGYQNWTTGVAPLLLKENLPATFYITTGQFEGTPMWHERLAQAVGHYAGTAIAIKELGSCEFPIHTLSQRRDSFRRIEKLLKYQTLKDRKVLLEALEREAGVLPETVQRMHPSHLRTLDSMGFSIGAHTANHPILTFCNNEEAIVEIAQVRESLGHMIGKPVTSFAYPNGRWGIDFTEEHVSMVRKAGYSHAVTTDSGVAHESTSVYKIPRFTPWGDNSRAMSFQVARNILLSKK